MDSSCSKLALSLTQSYLDRTFQGEGIQVGMPATFIRFHGCSVKCSFCDFDYLNGRVTKTVEELFLEIKNTTWEPLVVFSGGEPLEQNQDALGCLARQLLCRALRFVAIETSGTVIPKRELYSVIDFWTVSPKLLSADYAKPTNWEAVVDIAKYTTDSQLKLVICNRKDFDEAKEVLEKYGSWFRDRVLVPVWRPNSDAYKRAFVELLGWSREVPYCRVHAQFHKLLGCV